jgi:fucose 4-O-acetylase-like acetyltransferase
VFIILVIFHVLSWIMVYFYQGNVLRAMGNFPYGVLWYLLSLIYWRIILYYTPRALHDRPALHLGIALALSVLCGLTHLGNTLSIQRTLNFYIFFLLGYYYRQGMLPTRWWHNNALHGLVALVSLPLLLWLFPRCGNLLNGADHYALSDIPQKLLILAASISMSLLVFNITPDMKPMRQIGRDSLFYYVYHYFIFDLSLAPVIRGFQWPLTLPYMLLYCAITMAVLWLLSKNRVFRSLAQPMIKRRDRSPSRHE